MVILFGAYALVDGLFRVITALKDSRRYTHWGILLLEGVPGIALGILAFIWPDITALALLYLIAAWALVTGILEIIVAIWLRRELKGKWLLGGAGRSRVGSFWSAAGYLA